MSNDKVAAAVHGAPSDRITIRAYAVGHAHGQHREHTQVRDWECAQRWFDGELRGGEPETTGEHTQAKLADDPYTNADLLAENAKWARRTELLHQDFAPPRRGWTPTPTELVLAVVIVLAIIGIFTFIVAAY
jgi:hypothetical protein